MERIYRAIIVTGESAPYMNALREVAIRIFRTAVSELKVSPYNQVRSFIVFPDGSNEMTIQKEEWNQKRDQFIKELTLGNDWDVSWTEIEYGRKDEGWPFISRHSNEEKYRRPTCPEQMDLLPKDVGQAKPIGE